jgi:hypothetical protein
MLKIHGLVYLQQPSNYVGVTRAMIYTTLNATPMQLVFGRDSILNIKFQQVKWKYIKERKEKIMLENDEQESKKQIAYGIIKNTIQRKVRR